MGDDVERAKGIVRMMVANDMELRFERNESSVGVHGKRGKVRVSVLLIASDVLDHAGRKSAELDMFEKELRAASKES